MVEVLREAGHDAVHVGDVLRLNAPDADILENAARDERVIVAADTDFGELLANRQAAEPSVVLFHRQTGRRPREQAALLLANLSSVEMDLRDGAVVVVEERRVRVRPLPITETGTSPSIYSGATSRFTLLDGRCDPVATDASGQHQTDRHRGCPQHDRSDRAIAPRPQDQHGGSGQDLDHARRGNQSSRRLVRRIRGRIAAQRLRRAKPDHSVPTQRSPMAAHASCPEISRGAVRSMSRLPTVRRACPAAIMLRTGLTLAVPSPPGGPGRQACRQSPVELAPALATRYLPSRRTVHSPNAGVLVPPPPPFTSPDRASRAKQFRAPDRR